MSEISKNPEVPEIAGPDKKGYQEIKAEGDISAQEARDFWDDLFSETIGGHEGEIGGVEEIDTEAKIDSMETMDQGRLDNLEDTKITDMPRVYRDGEVDAGRYEDVGKTEIIPRNGGEWSGEAGKSDWKPDRDTEPGDRNGTNPEHKTWGEIMDQYGVESIPFQDGDPDFSEVSKGEVQIDDYTDDRDANFAQADVELAEQRGCTPEEVAQWRKEHGYTWHECKDCKTMQKVPTEVHGNVSHSGGISEYKSQKQSE